VVTQISSRSTCQINVSVPEPASIACLGVGLALLGGIRRRRGIRRLLA
jgi:hypothetical protein